MKKDAQTKKELNSLEYLFTSLHIYLSGEYYPKFDII